jgi:hypothetical protein
MEIWLVLCHYSGPDCHPRAPLDWTHATGSLNNLDTLNKDEHVHRKVWDLGTHPMFMQTVVTYPGPSWCVSPPSFPS